MASPQGRSQESSLSLSSSGKPKPAGHPPPIAPATELELGRKLLYNLRTMSNATQPKLTKWPFLVGDLLLVGVGAIVATRSPAPLGSGELYLLGAVVALGAWLAIIPFLLEYKALARLTEAADLAAAMAQLKKIEDVAKHINDATAQWQGVNGEAARAAGAAKEVADRMAEEAKAFGDFMQRANDNEKATLRLEVEKLRRAEGDSLHVLVRILDHVFALHQAGVRSGQATLIEQLTHFQNACIDATRRLGLAPFIARPEEKFDAQRHQLAEENATAPADAVISDTLAVGYTFQGRLLRPALVKLRAGAAPENPAPPALPVEPSAPN